MKAYFAHPMRTYNTQEEQDVLKVIAKKGWNIVNPKNYSTQAKRLGSGTDMSCQDCKTKIMAPLFYKLLRECPVFIYWNPLGTCGVNCEYEIAKQEHKQIVRYPEDFKE